MNFRKYANVLLVFFLLISNLGVSFIVHYCDDEIVSVSVNSETTYYEVEKDCCGVIEVKSKCCKNKTIKSNEKFDQITVKSIALNSNYFLVCNDWKPLEFPSAFNFLQKESSSYYCDANAPPFFLLYSQYTFYG
ncbi:HYC_CC_PP family protein [Flavobacterium sp.]|uniref:HYC_CC_PP family protein n=1 Tax=Flavobacterium sp. TaxID=239 RepID=UPI003BC69DFC